MMKFNILVVKETRSGEARVGLIPEDVVKLVGEGHSVFIEDGAGELAGFSNQDYIDAGAIVRKIPQNNLAGYRELFAQINLLVRVKRADREREQLECLAIPAGTIMVGALDPLEKDSSHIKEYHQAGIIAYSLDQLDLAAEDPLNMLAGMSKIAGKLALLDGVAKLNRVAAKVVIIGFGVVGQAAFAEARSQNLPVVVILGNRKIAQELIEQGAKTVLLDYNASLEMQQEVVCNELQDADIVITSARKAKQPAPLLIPWETLDKMRSGSVVLDMALSEGGNVAGSEHDKTLICSNEIIVSNVSGYPKVVPHEASILWSSCNRHFIELLSEDVNHPKIAAAKI